MPLGSPHDRLPAPRLTLASEAYDAPLYHLVSWGGDSLWEGTPHSTLLNAFSFSSLLSVATYSASNPSILFLARHPCLSLTSLVEFKFLQQIVVVLYLKITPLIRHTFGYDSLILHRSLYSWVGNSLLVPLFEYGMHNRLCHICCTFNGCVFVCDVTCRSFATRSLRSLGQYLQHAGTSRVSGHHAGISAAYITSYQTSELLD